MTKSEARAIHESAVRALRILQRPVPFLHLTEEQSNAVWDALKPAAEEVERINDMANVELGKAK